MAQDPNKSIFLQNPHNKTNFPNEIYKLMKTPCYDNGHGYSGNKKSLFKYYDYVLDKCNHDGLWLEFGVMTGLTINYISTKTQNKVYGFDSFQGLPEDWYNDVDFGKQGTFRMENLPNVNSNVELIIGWFKDTLPNFTKQHPEHCSMIHIDSDLYSSAKTIFENLKNRIVSGTILMFDEYWYIHRWQEHEYKAFMEFIEETKLQYEYIAHTDRACASIKIL